MPKHILPLSIFIVCLSISHVFCQATCPLPGQFVSLDDGDGKGFISNSYADFDNDGDLDIVAAAFGDDEVYLFWNDGRGVYPKSEITFYDVGDSPRGTVAKDFDNDGRIDFAITNRASNDLMVFINEGDRVFSPPLTFNVGDGPGLFESADLDGDGDLDLAIPNLNSNTISILLNDGAGGFVTVSEKPVGQEPYELVIQDIDSDGDFDICVACRADDHVALLNNLGGGAFADASNVVVGDRPISIVAIDVDGDLDVDLMTAETNSGSVSLLLNLGGGTFSVFPMLQNIGEPYSLKVIDFDGDSDLDLLVAGEESAGSFIQVSLYRNDSGDFSFVDKLASPISASFPSGLLGDTGDLNGDSNPDFSFHIFGSNFIPSGLGVFFLSKEGLFSNPDTIEASKAGDVVSADFDSDGDIDLAVTDREANEVRVYCNNGDGTFDLKVAYTGYTDVIFLDTGDMNEDGIVDLVVKLQRDIALLLGNGDATFYDGGVFVLAGNPVTGGVMQVVDDFNSDGHLDVVSGVGPTLSMALGAGDGTFSNFFSASSAHGDLQAMAAADFDGDGFQDLVLAGRSRPVVVIYNDSTGDFLNKEHELGSNNVFGVATGDFDLDGDIDIASSSSRVVVWANDGNGNFTFSNSFAVNGTGQLLAVDFDQDGDLDLISAGRYVELLINDGTGDFSSGFSQIVGGDVRSLVVDDLNNNSLNDIAVSAGPSFIISTDAPSFLSFFLQDCSQNQSVPVGDVFVLRGSAVQGQLVDVIKSDDAYLYAEVGFTLNSDEPPVWVQFESEPFSASRTLSVSLESRVSTPGLTRTTEAFNWNTGEFQIVEERAGAFGVDSLTTLPLAPVSEFVDPVTNVAEMRAGWRQTGFTINFPWAVNIDFVGWTQ